MKASDIIESRLQHLRRVMANSKATRSIRTERTYVGWMRRFLTFWMQLPEWRTLSPEDAARQFVETHARTWAVATQNQFRNALVFYFKHVAGKPLGDLGPWSQAKRPKRLPVWLPHADMMRLLACLKGDMRLMAEIAYGSGLRSHELTQLRWKDIDFNRKTLTVRAGKGDKDRVTFLPESVIPALIEHRERMRALWECDRRLNREGVSVPSVKFDGKAWPWFWVFAAHAESIDPRSGIRRRHHIHRSALGQAIRRALPTWGGDKRVTVHSLRHSFATECLMNGMPIHELKDLLGHAHIETTMIYAHVLPRLTMRRGSPLDQTDPGKILPFSPPPAVAALAPAPLRHAAQ